MAQKAAATRKKETIRSEYRRRELEWCRTHVTELAHFAGEWVVLEGEEVIAHGRDVGRVVAKARRKGVKVPYVFYVQEPGSTRVVHLGS